MPLLRLLLSLAAATVLASPAASQFTVDTVSYHGVSAAAHQAQFNLLEPQGYRITSLAVSGNIGSAAYSAVWTRTSGPNWVAAHGMTHAQYLNQRTSWSLTGFRPVIVTAAGSGANEVWAAVYAQDGIPTAHDVDLSTNAFEADVAARRAAGMRLVSCATYGATGSALYAPVYKQDASGLPWGCAHGLTVTEMNAAVPEYAHGEVRPAFLAMGGTQRYLGVFRDDRMGAWAVVYDRTSAQLNADKVNADAQGLVPLCIAASGTGTSARYAAIFAERITPYARTLTRTGVGSLAMLPFDDYMTDLMLTEPVRAASIAVCKDGRLVYARGYTHAEPGYTVTQPTSLFRMGSISKALTGMLAHDLIEHGVGNLQLTTPLVGQLGILTYSQGAQSIELRHLLQHTSGLANAIDEVAWAATIPGMPLPIDENQVTRFAVQTPLTTLGQYEYSNNGMTAAGQLIENATGLDYFTVLQQRLWAPVQASRLHRMQALRSQLHPDEVHYHLRVPYLRAGNLYADSRPMAPQYCQRFWDSAGAVVTSTVDLARVLAGAFSLGADSPLFSVARQQAALAQHEPTKHYAQNETHRVTACGFDWAVDAQGRTYYVHRGSQDGFYAIAIVRDDGVVIVCACNGDASLESSTLRAKADLVTDWGTSDQFPSFGMPSFPRTPQLGAPLVSTKTNLSKTPFVFFGSFLDQVSSVQFGNHVLQPGDPTRFEQGYFAAPSPTVLHVYPPAALPPGLYHVQPFSAQGGGTVRTVTITLTTSFTAAAQDYVVGGAMPFSIYAGQGTLSDLSLVALAASQSALPSSLPGLLSLDLGNGFSDYFLSDWALWNPLSRTVRWNVPGLGPWTIAHVQMVGADFGVPDLFPLPVSNRITIDRQ